jgi:GNAT superfamily N-acetyltransferase
MIFRDARRDEVARIVALLADDELGAGRETGVDDAYLSAFDDIAADPRSRGLGRTMLGWAIEAARRDGCGLVQLTSDKRRADAIRFYESLGFEASHEGLKLPL